MRTTLLVILWLLLPGCTGTDSGSNSNNINNSNNMNNTNNVNNVNNTNNVNNVNNTNNTADGGVDADADGTVDPPECVVTNPLANPPAFTFPPEESWNHSIISGGTAASGSPYHMIHDEMATPGETISLRAKFDYNAVLHKDLQDEYVNFYIWGTGMTQWQEAGRFLTDSDGMIFLDLDPLPVGTYIVRAVVVGDLTHADGYVTVVASGRRAVVFDIDGTLTTSDSEVMQDWANFSTAEMYPYANQVVNHYVNLGYQIVMVTGRPYWLAADTRAWLTSLSMPATSVRFTSDNGTTISGQETELYKTTYLQDLVTRCGLQIIRAYGNATTDIGAYDAVGVPKAETFIIGDNAGVDNTQPIVCEGCGYQTHYLDFLSNETLPCGLPQ